MAISTRNVRQIGSIFQNRLETLGSDIGGDSIAALRTSLHFGAANPARESGGTLAIERDLTLSAGQMSGITMARTIDPGPNEIASVLAPGAAGIAIIGVSTEDTIPGGEVANDTISFILLTAIGSGTVIYFTDRNWNGSAFAAAGGGEGTFTFTAASDMAAGSVVTISQAQLTTAGMALSDAGETIYAYQGAINAPSVFLHAVDIADGTAGFDGNELLNTGLVNGVSAVSIADDNAEFGTRTHNISSSDLFTRINDATDWVHNDNSPQDGSATGTPAFTAPDAQIWVSGSGAGEGIVTINLDGTYNSGTVGYQIVQAFQNDANLFHPSDVTFDTVEGKVFFVDADLNGHNRIIQINISDLLTNPGSAMPFTVLYSNAGTGATGSMRTLSVDTVNNIIYFDIGTTFNKINYNTANQTPTVLATLPSYITQATIDYVHGTVLLGSSSVTSVFGQDVIDTNVIYRATGLTAGSSSLTFSELPFNPDDAGLGGEGSPLGGESWPVERGTIRGIDIDPVTQIAYIVTGSVILDNDGNGNTTYFGGIYSYALTGNPTGTVTTLYTQTGLPGSPSGTGPSGLLYYIEVDPATGKYYVIDETGTNALSGDGAVWTGSLTVPGTPTLVGTVGSINGLGPQGLEIQHASILTGTAVGSTFTETAGNPSPNGTAVTVGTGFNATDSDSGTDPNNDQLAGAQVRISTNFQSGAGHADQLLVSTFNTGTNQNGTIVIGGDTVTYAYNAATGVMTFTGITSLDNYENILGRVQFRSDGDNPTNYGAAGTRIVSFSTFDGLLYSDEVNLGVTVTGINDAPINAVGGTHAATEDASSVITGVSVSDVDANPATQDIQVTLTVAHGTLTLLTNVSGGIDVTDIAGNGTATVVIIATQNQINATFGAASGITYTPTGDYNGADALTVTTNDLGLNGTDAGLSGNGTSEQDQDVKTIAIANVNDAPTVIDATQTAATILEDTPSNLGETVSSLFTASFADVLDQQQTGPNPTGSVANTLAGIAVVGGSTSASGSWQYFNGAIWVNIGAATTASAVLVSAATAIRFNPALNFNGSPPDLIVHLVDSSGAAITNGSTVNLTGATGGTTRYSTATVALSESVTAVNDAPVNTVGGPLGVAEDSSANNVTGMSISDVDANPATDVFSVTLDVLHGTLNMSIVVPGGVTSVTGNGTATLVVSGTINQINATLAALGGLTYTPTGNYNGSDRVQITTDDGGATGLDPGATGTATSEADIDSKTINVTAVNDPVTGTAPATLTLAEDATNVAVTGLSISDVDATLAPAGVYNVTLTSTNGTLTLGSIAGLNFTVGDGTADATMTFHGTLAAINNALAITSYTPTANYNGSATITLNVTDTFGGIVATGTGAATNDSDVVNVTVTAVNDPVTGTAPASLLLNEDATNVAVTGLSISDVDTALAPAGVYDVTLAASNGTLTLTTLTGLTFTVGDGTADATMTFHGTLADINTALATANYTPTANYNGAATITLGVTDTFGGIVATGTGAATSDSDVVNVTVTAVNDTPVVGVQTAVASIEQVAGFIDPAATIADVELGALDNYAGSALTVGRLLGAQPEDLLTFGASGAFTVNGANLEAGGLVFATFSGGNGANLVISFTGTGTPATQALVNAVIQALQYTYTGDTPPASIQMVYSFNDGAPGSGQGGGGSPVATDVIQINITDTPENVAPALDLDGNDSNTVGTGYTAAFTEGGAAVLITDADVTIVDPDAGDNIEGATIAINGPVAGDQLVLGPQGGFVVTGSGTGTITITGTGTAAQYQAMLAQITFTNTSDDPGTSRTINISVTDGTDTSNIAVATINIAEINDEPTLTATGGTPTFTEGGAAADLFSGVTASTIESGQTFASLTLTVTNVTDGAAEILRINGVDVALTNGNSVNTGIGTANVTLAGSTATVVLSGLTLNASQLQTVVDALAYNNTSENPTDANRVVTLTEVTDSGSNVSPNDNTTTLNIAATVNVDPVNDAPINSVPGTQTINEDGSVTLSTGNGNALSVSDADATTLTVTLTVLHGTLTLASTAGLSFGAGDGTADATMTFSGTAAAINAALGSGLTYNPNANYNGSDSITVFTTDNGQSGGPTQTDNDTVTVNITAINDAPVVIGDGTESATTINEDSPGAGQTIQALFAGQYSDAADNQIPNGGASSPGQFSGIAVTANGSSGATGQWQYFSGGVWTDIGAASDGAAKLFGDPFVTLIRFNPAANYNGPAPTLTVHLIDNSLPFSIVNGQVVDLSGPGATGGTTAYSTGTVVLSQDVTAVNDGPLNNVPGTQTINEDASFTLSTGNGNAISVADTDATTLTVTLTVVHGTLTLASTVGLSFGAGDGTADLTMTFSGTAAAINAALGSGLTYNPTANYNGPDSIAVLTTDNGQTGTGGTLQDNDSIAITINSVNDAPAGTDKAVTINEDASYVFAIGDFGFTDPNDTPANPLLSVRITTLPTNGTLFFDSDGAGGAAPVAVVAGQFILGSEIVLGKLSFVPNANANGTPLSSFTFQVQDNGGTANGGVDLDQSPNTFTFNVTAVNDAPVITLGTTTVSIPEDASFGLFGASSISVADPDATTLTMTLSVAHGTLTLGNPAGLSFSTGDGTGDVTMTFSGTASAINAALASGVNYNPTANYNGPDAISITTTDNGQSGSGPVGTDSDTIAITVTPVNDAPSGADNVLTGSEDDPLVFTAADFGFTDPVEGNAFLAVIIDTFPANGTLFLDSDGPGGAAPVNLATVGAGVFVSVADINAGHLYFQPDADEYGDAYASFTFRVQDDGGMLNGGVDRDPVANTITIDIEPDNLPPVVDLDSGTGGVNYTTTFVEDGAAVAIGSGVLVSDPDSVALGDLIESATVTLTDRVAGDSLTLTGALPPGFVAVTTNLVGSITIQITGTGTGAQYQALIQSILYATTNQDPTVGGTDLARTITVTVNDGDIDSAVATTTININAIDDLPVAQPDAFTITESGTIAGGNLFANNGSGADTDPDGPPLTISAVNGSGANVGTTIVLASGASLTVNANGTFDYDPGTAFLPTPTSGSGASNTPAHDSFTYTLAGGNSVTVTITLTGLDTDDTLLGTAGADILAGGNGNDTYVVENSVDQVIEAVGGGNDLVTASTSYALNAGAEVETLSTTNAAGTAAIALTGNEFGQTIIGNAGNNFLYGNGGADILDGGAGDDVIIVDADDQVVEAAGGGNDLVAALTSYTLNAGAEVESLSTVNSGNNAAIALTGNEFGQTIIGNAGANILDGGGGVDTLQGLGGNDTYLVDSADDLVIEAVGDGNDRVRASASYALAAGAEVETLSTTNDGGTAAIALTGNEFGQTITGNAGGNFLYGGGGADILDGGAGDDVIIVDADDQVVEAVGGGNDLVAASTSYALNAGAEVEILSTVNSGNNAAIALTGNEFGQTIIGNAGNNFLDGGGGADILEGGAGDDVIIVDADDQVIEAVGGGNDLVAARTSYALAAGVEVEILSTVNSGNNAALDLTGNEFGQTIIGNAGANILDGGGGADILDGGAGDDTLIVDAGDQVIEAVGGGNDLVTASTSYALNAGAEVESLSTTNSAGTAAIALTGNEFGQTIIGNAGNNFLNGGGGADILQGLAGNDTYIVDNAGDQVIEAAGGGNDLVAVSTSYALNAGAEVEILSTVNGGGNAAIALTGNELGQTIIGNDGGNVLDGKGGNDVLIGQAGADIYAFTTALGAGNVDIVLGFAAGSDKIALDDAVFTAIGGLGTLNANAFVTGSAAADASDRIVYNSATGQLFYDADGNGAGAAVLFAQLSPGLSLTASDFTVI
jgi:Ca2+-binding RTX toxin-like protein